MAKAEQEVYICYGVKGGTLYHSRNGYFFKKKGSRGNTIFLECRDKKCRARAMMYCNLDSGIFPPSRSPYTNIQHNHKPDEHFELVEELKRKMLERCKTEYTPIAEIFREESKRANPEVASRIRYASFERTMHRIRAISLPRLPPPPLETYVDALQVTSRYSILEQSESMEPVTIIEIKCYHCDKTFSKNSNLSKHLRRVHKEYQDARRPQPKKTKEIRCWHCNQIYSNITDLNKHLRQLHRLAMKFHAPNEKTVIEKAQKVFTCAGWRGGKRYHIRNGYYYRKYKNIGNKWFLKCVVSRCGARVVTDCKLETWTIPPSQSSILHHNHKPDIYFEQVEAIKRKMLHRCRTESTRLRTIFQEEIERINPEVASQLKYDSFVRSMTKMRAAAQVHLSSMTEAYVDTIQESTSDYILQQDGDQSIINFLGNEDHDYVASEMEFVEIINLTDAENEEYSQQSSTQQLAELSIGYCIMCKSSPKDHLCRPCNHINYCGACTASLQLQTTLLICPRCSLIIENIEQVYF